MPAICGRCHFWRIRMSEYPKMLYSGDKESYSSRIIHTAEEEQQFRDIGLIDYADLPEPEPIPDPHDPSKEGEAPQGFVTTEQFDAVAERLAAAEAEIAELKQAGAPVANDSGPSIGYNALSKEQLQALITER